MSIAYIVHYALREDIAEILEEYGKMDVGKYCVQHPLYYASSVLNREQEHIDVWTYANGHAQGPRDAIKLPRGMCNCDSIIYFDGILYGATTFGGHKNILDTVQLIHTDRRNPGAKKKSLRYTRLSNKFLLFFDIITAKQPPRRFPIFSRLEGFI